MFFINNKKNKRGYSLFETVVYIALFSAVSMAVLMSVDVSVRIYRNARINNLITESGNSAMERITRSIRTASSVTNNSVTGSALGVLELLNPDGTSVRIYISNGAVLLNENGVLSGSLTNQNLSVPSLFFYKIDTPEGVAVKTELLLTHSQTNKVEKFQTTTILRNSY